jgi:hypothetical protein
MSSFARYVTPWKYRREQDELRLTALRHRDGDNCRRCRRPMRFDLPAGHDMGPKLEEIAPPCANEPEAIDYLVLCHRRCNGEGADQTREVQQRVRMKSEAELFANNRKRA